MREKLTPREAELLLGGHAAGTLTDVERTALFQAALDHQEVFDALMDEEALRELLADPSARAQLLAALAEPPKVVPLWRRHPGALGLAASLLIAVTAGVAYYRTPAAQERTLEKARPTGIPSAPATPSPATTPSEGAADKASERGLRLRKQAEPGAPIPEPKELPRALPEAIGAVPSGSPSPSAAAPAAAPPPPPPAEVFRDAEAAPPPKAEVAKEKADRAGFARSEERKAARPAQAPPVHGPAAQNQFLNNQLQTNAVEQEPAPAAKKVMGPSWSLEEGGKVLVVRHPAGQALVLLHRSPRGPVQVPPRTPTRGEAGITRFDLGAEPGPWDLYVLSKAVADPLRLPEQGPFEGYRARVLKSEPPVR